MFCHNISFDIIKSKKGEGTFLHIQQERTLDGESFNEQKAIVSDVFMTMKIEVDKCLRKLLKL